MNLRSYSFIVIRQRLIRALARFNQGRNNLLSGGGAMRCRGGRRRRLIQTPGGCEHAMGADDDVGKGGSAAAGGINGQTWFMFQGINGRLKGIDRRLEGIDGP